MDVASRNFDYRARLGHRCFARAPGARMPDLFARVGNSDICGHNLVLSTANADQVWKGQKETGTGLSIISPSRPTDNETCHIGLIGRYIGNELLQASDYDLRGFRPIPIT